MDERELKNIIEVFLFCANEPLSSQQIHALFDEHQRPTVDEISVLINQLNFDYSSRSFEVKQTASGYQVQTKAKYSDWVARLQIEKPVKYSRALLETLVIIAYKQPVTRADIEEIRGVAVSSPIMKTLMERQWIRIAGHKDVAGKPAVYCTTKEFLDFFNLTHLNQLPPLSEPLSI